MNGVAVELEAVELEPVDPKEMLKVASATVLEPSALILGGGDPPAMPPMPELRPRDKAPGPVAPGVPAAAAASSEPLKALREHLASLEKDVAGVEKEYAARLAEVQRDYEAKLAELAKKLAESEAREAERKQALKELVAKLQ